MRHAVRCVNDWCVASMRLGSVTVSMADAVTVLIGMPFMIAAVHNTACTAT